MTTVETETPTLTVPASRLRHALQTALLFAGKDRTLPAFRGVQFSAKRGEAPTFLATDRYVAVEVTLTDVSPTDIPAGLIPTDDVKRLIASLASVESSVSVTVAPAARLQLAFSAGEGQPDQIVTASYHDGFPEMVRSLLTPAETDRPAPFALRAEVLANLGKLKHPDRRTTAKDPVVVDFTLCELRKPVGFTVDNWLRGIAMPWKRW